MTRSTLRFGAAAQKIENRPKINEVLDDSQTLLKQYRERIDVLEKKVEEFKQLQEDKNMLEEKVVDLQSKVESLQKQEVQHDQAEIKLLSSRMVSATTHTSWTSSKKTALPNTTINRTLKRDNENLRKRQEELRRRYQYAQMKIGLQQQRRTVLQNCMNLSQKFSDVSPSL